MICSLMDLRNKEVVNISNGEKLGFVDDIEIDTETSTVIALIVYGRERLWGLFGRDDDLIISCKEIKLIGKDTILVAHNSDIDEMRKPDTKSTKFKSFRFENLYK